jgi:hypothetical protein
MALKFRMLGVDAEGVVVVAAAAAEEGEVEVAV